MKTFDLDRMKAVYRDKLSEDDIANITRLQDEYAAYEKYSKNYQKILSDINRPDAASHQMLQSYDEMLNRMESSVFETLNRVEALQKGLGIKKP